jgi:hypothetical protein
MRQTIPAFLSVLGAVGALTTFPVAAAAQKLVGQWDVQYERGSATTHGANTARTEGSARMTLRHQGDSVFGQWQQVVAPGEPLAPVYEMRGVVKGDSGFVLLVPNVDADAGMLKNFANDVMEFLKTHLHGMPPMTTVLEFRINGDALSGVRRSVSEDGSVKTTGRPMTAVRAKR